LPSRISQYIAKQTQRKRGRAAQATPLGDGAASKTKKPKVDPKLPTKTPTAADNSISPASIAAPGSNITAASSSSNLEPSTHKKKRGRKAAATTGSNGSARPKPQENVAQKVIRAQPKDAADPQEEGVERVTATIENEEGVATTIEDTDEVPEVNNKPPAPPVQDKRFSTVNGRIVPSGKRTARAICDFFTEKEQLALYERYFAIAHGMYNHFGDRVPAELWCEMWQEVALAVPGRSVINCIEFYVDNEEKFTF
jgi:hypothetical protein